MHRTYLKDLRAAFAGIYVTRTQNLTEGTADFTFAFVRDNHNETFVGWRDDGFMDYVEAIKVQLDIDDDTWMDIVKTTDINVFTYLWIVDGFTPEKWPPWREDEMTVDPRVAIKSCNPAG